MANGNLVSDTAKPGGMWGIVLIILGMLCIAAPFVAGAFTTMMIGVSLVVAGGVITFAAFQAESWGIGIFAVLMGLATAIAGFVLLARPAIGMVSIALALAIYFMFDGIFQIVGAFRARPAPGWGFFLFGGIVSVALGYIIYSDWPISGGWVVGTLVGIHFLFVGMTLMMLSSAQRAMASVTKS